MPKYFDFMICGYYLYFTSHCIVEAMHVHASDKRLTEAGSAKFFVKGNSCLIDGNLWPSKPLFQAIYDSLMDIFDLKTKTFMSKQCFMRQPNPERGYSWKFKNNNSWTFMAHWWQFMTKNTNSA